MGPRRRRGGRSGAGGMGFMEPPMRMQPDEDPGEKDRKEKECGVSMEKPNMLIGLPYIRENDGMQGKRELAELLEHCGDDDAAADVLLRATGVLGGSEEAVTDTFKLAMVVNIVNSGRINELKISKKVRADSLHTLDVAHLAEQHGITDIVSFAEYIDEGIEFRFFKNATEMYRVTVYGSWYTRSGIDEMCSIVGSMANGKQCREPAIKRGLLVAVRFETIEEEKVMDCDMNELACIFKWVRNMCKTDVMSEFSKCCEYE